MEILIPGLILVALMVYVSTRIKKAAASAYDEELIETDEFAIAKPDGFIIPADDESPFAFAAYSKEFGIGDADEIRQVSAELTIYENEAVEEIRESIFENEVKLISEQRLVGNALLLETESTFSGTAIGTEHRIIEKSGKVFHLAVSALADNKEKQQSNIDTFLTSFEVK
ncbi:MAG: hypothetical protein ACRD6X_02220 [Pyrinomonadaceae bacterium]